MLAWKHMPGYLDAVALVLSCNPNAITHADRVALTLPTLSTCNANLRALSMLHQLTRGHDAFYTWILAKLLT